MLERFKAFNKKHRKLARFLVYPEIAIITLGSVIKYLFRHFLVVVALIVVLLVAVFAIKNLGSAGRQSGGSDVAENVVVGESSANGEMAVQNAEDNTVASPTVEEEAAQKEAAAEEAADEVADEVAAEEPVIEEPAADESATEESTAEESAAEGTVADESVAEVSVAEEVVTEETVVQESSAEASAAPAIVPGQDVNAVFEQYPEAVAWITFEDGLLDCPVMQDGDNDKYRIKDYTGADSNTGSIFMDYRSSAGFDDPNTIIYGHNMKDYSMFGIFKYYRDNKSFLGNHKYFSITTPEGSSRYMIFAYMNAPKGSEIYDVVGNSSDKMRSFLDKIEVRTFIDTGIEPSVDDKIITLSTCTESDDLYFVLFAVKCD